MKALTQPAVDATLRSWASKYYLLEIEFTVPTPLTLRMSDRYVVAAGQEWFPFVLDWGNLIETVNTVDVGGQPATVDVILTDTRPVAGRDRLSALIRSEQNTAEAFEWQDATVTVRQLDEGLGTDDVVPLGEFFIQEPTDMGGEHLTVRMASKDLLIEDKSALETITKDGMPLADPDVFGQIVPVIFGHVPGVRAYPIVAGGRTTLVAAITATSPAVGEMLRLSDVARFPASGILQVDEEKIRFRRRRTVSNEGEVTVVERGYRAGLDGNSAAAGHAAGAAVAEVRSGPKAFRYVVSMNLGDDGAGGSKYRTRSVSKVMVHGALQDVTVDYDEEFPPGSGKRYTIINFAALPILKRQVNLTVDDKLTVGDDIAVTSPNVSMLKRLSTALPLTVTASGRGSALALKLIPLPAIPDGRTEVVRAISYSVTSGGVLGTWSIRIGDDAVAGGSRTLESRGTFTPVPRGGTFRYSTGRSASEETLVVRWQQDAGAQSDASISVTINSYELDIEYPLSLNKTGNAARSGEIGLVGNSTADIVIGGDVTCDVEGLQDDAAGTISGTPSLLLTNPADITKVTLLEVYPHSVVGDIGATFPITRAALHAAGYRWDFCLLERSFGGLRLKLGEQAACALHLESGRWEYPRLRFGTDTKFYATEFRPTAAAPFVAAQLTSGGFTAAASSVGAAIWTLDYERAWWDGEPVVVSRSPRTETWTRLRAFFARAWDKSGAAEDQYTVVRTFGDRTKTARERSIELEFIRHAATASAVANFWLKHWRRQRWIIRGVCFWNALALEKFDVITVPNHPVLAAHPGVAFRVHRKVYRLADENPGRIELEGIEANP